ncbi:LIM zinc finger domain containing protein [Entamoeba nuttalli P19]|uniref:LIM zinc finger domain containing protein n=1 Tax=Entamoeba nuttalli (strain P19) TaxID=1076696 RepID=K2H2J1_ENTNP|nr:LIM zinc finger domain containing protein [Entamoeba nuttalli P19]EKE40542.1 LIM zinc finger domain containing protein [Entamoeba nuttalli P19]|eukprot:XP_008857130.1 LIM zinc finger domain containing protein [Entamoeba nuttalli P19]
MSTCPVCGKKAYQMEAIKIEGITMHKNCFRCSVCKKILNGANFAKNHGVYYCKVHFQQMFREKGNYDEGFGYTKHSADWEKKDEEHHVEQKHVEKKTEKPVEVKKEETKPVEVKKEETKPAEVKKEITFSPEIKNQIDSILKVLDKMEGIVSKLESCGISSSEPIKNEQVDNVFARLEAVISKLEKK